METRLIQSCKTLQLRSFLMWYFFKYFSNQGDLKKTKLIKRTKLECSSALMFFYKVEVAKVQFHFNVFSEVELTRVQFHLMFFYEVELARVQFHLMFF